MQSNIQSVEEQQSREMRESGWGTTVEHTSVYFLRTVGDIKIVEQTIVVMGLSLTLRLPSKGMSPNCETCTPYETLLGGEQDKR